MRYPKTPSFGFGLAWVLALAPFASGQSPLSGTEPWRLGSADPAMAMVDAIGSDLDRKLADAPKKRAQAIKATPANLSARKKRLAEIVGVVDARVARPGWEAVQPSGADPFPIESDIHARLVRWPVLEGVHGEGILLQGVQTISQHRPIRINEGGNVMGLSPSIAYKKPARDLIILTDADEMAEQLAGLLEG